ncbi:N-acetylglucosamine-6-phosphate deacetylase [Naasia sp. SYSU D00057]|uniref:N-acetylglucosamine-6-phosphate deacetylase n=1 Tax=Naasia sp. SYSU D00057 TaxID=2817380 RepID=UPI001B303985|nr:N-acetylglucosamine-6-phosphate deacetylase [Naasia sp. SYSU D00057]
MTARIVHSATLTDADGVRPSGWVRSEGGRITAVGDGDGWRRLPSGADVIDAGGRRVVPGFLDLHGHGGGGFSYDTGTSSEILAGVALHRRHGTTGAVLSLVAASVGLLEERLRLVAALRAVEPGILGVHLEGPFLAPSRRGAHDPARLIAPDSSTVDRLLEAAAGNLRSVTIAPELPGALDAVERFSAAGVVVAVGHTDADYDTARAAFDRGARLLTHAFNAMPGIGSRAPGPIGAAIDDGRVVLELILDGRHVHPSSARMLFALAPGRVALVTDAMAAAGGGDGDYRLGPLDVEVRDGGAHLAGTATLAGSTLTQDAALRYAVEELGEDPAAAVAALTATPAGLLGLADRGRIGVGQDARLLILDADWRTERVLEPVSGR